MSALPLDTLIGGLEGASRVRALSPAETLELERLLMLDYQRRVRLPDQIARARARVDTYVQRLSPADQLRELRAEYRRAWERLRVLEEALAPGARLARLQRELQQ